MTEKSKIPVGLAALLAALSMVSPFSIDTFFPSMRAMQAEFNIDALTMQQTLTAYLLPYAVMSLVYGSLSDALGRRTVVLWGLSLYTVASFACIFAPNFAALLAFRAVQGMTAGAGFAVSRAVIRDLYQGPDAQRLMSAVTVIFSLAPAIAPVVGGWIHVIFGWHGVFWLLTLVGVALVFACHRFLPETHPPELRTALHLATLAGNSWQIIRDPRFLLLALCSSFQFAAAMLYIGSAPAIVLDTWQLSETQFHQLFIPVIGGFLVGAIVSGRIAGRVLPSRQVVVGLLITFAAAVTSLILNYYSQPLPRLTQQVMIFCTSLGVQFVFPVLSLRVMDLYPRWRGSVASVQSFVQLSIGTIALGVVAPLVGGHPQRLAVTSVCASVLAIFFAWCARHRSAKPATVQRD